MKILAEGIKKDYKLLPEFAFQLRCHDRVDDYYTMKFLSDIRPSFLYDIILSNKWNKMQKSMNAKNGPFMITVGKSGEFENYFMYKETDQRVKYTKPLIKKQMSKSEKYSGEVIVYLTASGFQIGKGIKKLIPEKSEVQNGSSQHMVWAQSNYPYSDINGKYSCFIFEPQDPNDHRKGYKLFVNSGPVGPILVVRKINPIFSSGLKLTSSQKVINDKDLPVWFFNPKN